MSPVSFAQTAMDLSLDDDMSTGSEIYATARESSDEGTDDSAYATPRAHSIPPSYPPHPISRLHVPGSFQESSGFLTPMSVQPTNDVGVVSSPENFSIAESHSKQSTPGAHSPARDGDDDDNDDMHEQVSTSHSLYRTHHLQ